MAAADHVMLKDKDGKDVTVMVTKDTKDTNVKAKPMIKVEEIKAGTCVVITAVEQKDKSRTAKTIEAASRQRRPSERHERAQEYPTAKTRRPGSARTHGAIACNGTCQRPAC